MLNRYVCAGIVLLALGGIVRADVDHGAITKVTDTSIQTPDMSVGAFLVNKNTKVVKLTSKDALAMETLKSPLKGAPSSLDALKKAVLLASKFAPVQAVVVHNNTTATEIGYVDPNEQQIANKVNILGFSADKTIINFTLAGGKVNMGLKVDSTTKVLKKVGNAKQAPSTIADLQAELQRVPKGSLSGSVIYIPATDKALSIRYIVPDAAPKTGAAPKKK